MIRKPYLPSAPAVARANSRQSGDGAVRNASTTVDPGSARPTTSTTRSTSHRDPLAGDSMVVGCIAAAGRLAGADATPAPPGAATGRGNVNTHASKPKKAKGNATFQRSYHPIQ